MRNHPISIRAVKALSQHSGFQKTSGKLNYSKAAREISKYKPVTRQSLIAWSKGHSVIGAEYLGVVSEITGVPLFWLLYGRQISVEV